MLRLGAVLSEQLEARGFWSSMDQQQHITWKELKTVRLAVLSFLPLLRGREVLLHEDNLAVVDVFSHLTPRSPVMMDELWELIDTNNINVRARYIRFAANVSADRLSRETDKDDWLLNPRIFIYLDSMWGPHSIDMFATHGNSQLPRYNSRWRDPISEAVDCLHLPDKHLTTETN
jgi:hypothetical protein